MRRRRERMSADSTGWPLLDERPPPRAGVRPRTARRKRPRPAWALAVLAFVCGGLVSAAGFSIGWRHQAQRGSAAEAALVKANAHAHSLGASLSVAQRLEARTQARLAAARKSVRTLSREAASLATEASSSEHAATPVSSDAATVTSTAGKVAGELKTLSDYLTTTPAGQIDSGYVATQIAYLTRQLDALQGAGGSVAADAGTFQSAVRKLAADAVALSRP